MLFDLRGKRKRAVQATYLVLAVLMGGGLVLFGIGSGAGGGLLDAVGVGGHGGAGGGGGGGTVSFDDQIERYEERLAADPKDQRAASGLVRVRFQAGVNSTESEGGHGGQTSLTEESLANFRAATEAWERYLEVAKRPDGGIAQTAANAYASLGDARGAARAQAIVVKGQPTAATLGSLALYHYLAGQTRQGDAAAKRALASASTGERGALREQLEAAKRQASAAATGAEGLSSGGGHSAP